VEVGEMPPGQRDDHHPLPVGRLEVSPEATEQMVSDALPLVPADLRLGQETEVPRDGQRHIGERDGDLAACPGPATATFRGEQPDGGVEPAGDIPGGQHVVHRPGHSLRPGDQGESCARIDGVVDRGPPVPVPLNLDVDQVRPEPA
jgi:hypothetical protein